MFVRTMHRVSAVVAQVVLTPVVHVESAVHVVHGSLPVVDHVEPAAHGTLSGKGAGAGLGDVAWVLHSVSVVVVQSVSTPAAHVESAVHVMHGTLPEAEKDIPPTHGATAPLHTMSDPRLQAISTPAAAHVVFAEQLVHGA